MIINPYAFATTPAVTATWSPLSKYLSAPSVLSGSDLILSADTGASGTYANAVSSREIQHLGYYSGFIETNSGDTVGFGFLHVSRTNPATEAPGNSNLYVGNTGGSVGLWANSGDVYQAGAGTIAGAGALTLGVECAVRLAFISGTSFEVRMWLRQPGGSWYGGGDPAADTTPTHTRTGNAANVYFCLGASITRSGATSARKATLHGDVASTTGTPPTGFTKALWGPALT